jgi:hypothetical protein
VSANENLIPDGYSDVGVSVSVGARCSTSCPIAASCLSRVISLLVSCTGCIAIFCDGCGFG